MDAGQPQGGSLREPARLQPEISPASSTSRPAWRPLAQSALDDLELTDFSADEFDEAQAAADQLARRCEDLNNFNDFALAGFAGRKYEAFRTHLAAYGYPVVRSWIRRGLIYQFCAHQGRPVQITQADRLYLSDTSGEANDDRAELAIETNAYAMRFFEQHALRGGSWNYEGGASLRTYYVGACLLMFDNVLDRWTRERQRAIPPHHDDLLPVAPQPWSAATVDIDLDPALAVTSAMTVEQALDAMPASTREVAARVVFGGATFAEIATDLDLTERAVEGRLYRYRTELARRGRKAS